ncbi:MAG: hypothetical protein WCO08_02025 [Actinomycetes bacterium]
MGKRVRAWRCVACKSAIAEAAYYCKKCGALVDIDQAPNAREKDTSLGTKVRKFWQTRPFQKLGWSAVALAMIIAGGDYLLTLHKASSDNNSSPIFHMIVDAPDKPFTCTREYCQVTVRIINKTGDVQRLVGVPYMQFDSKLLLGPGDLLNATFADNFCSQKFDLVLQPHQTKLYIGICSQNLPKGGKVTSIQILDEAKNLVVSAPLDVPTPHL